MRDGTPQRIATYVFTALAFSLGCVPSPTVVDRTEWPLPMADLLAKYPKIANAITTYKHDAFIDSKFAWKIVGQADEIDRLIEELKLKEATTEHVKYKELQQSIPEAWALPNIKEAIVYVSDGYGETHQEGTDLLLLVRDPVMNETFVLYEWIF